MKKIIVVGGMQNGGGVSLFILRTYERMQQQHDISLVLFTQDGYNDYTERIHNNGWKQEFIPSIKANPIRNILVWIKLLKKYSDFNNIHFNLNNAIFWLPIFLSKILNKNVIVQSHTSSFIGNNKIKWVLHKIGRVFISKLADECTAVSDLAFRFMFNLNRNHDIIPVGIDTDEFRYSDIERNHLRKLYNLDGKIIIGHVGGFTPVKNHKFMIKIIDELSKKNKNYHLILIGDGNDYNEIKKIIKEKNIEEYVSLLGFKEKISEYYNMMDIFIYPSYYEGFPTSVIEAQTNGLPVIMSDTITDEAIIDKKTAVQKSIKNEKTWVDTILKTSLNNTRNLPSGRIKSYDVGVIADRLYDVENKQEK